MWAGGVGRLSLQAPANTPPRSPSPRGGQRHLPACAAKGLHTSRHSTKHPRVANAVHDTIQQGGKDGRNLTQDRNPGKQGCITLCGPGMWSDLLSKPRPAHSRTQHHTPPRRAATPSSGRSLGDTPSVTAPTTRAYPTRYSTPFSRGVGTGETGLKAARHRRPLPCATTPVQVGLSRAAWPQRSPGPHTPPPTTQSYSGQQHSRVGAATGAHPPPQHRPVPRTTPHSYHPALARRHSTPTRGDRRRGRTTTPTYHAQHSADNDTPGGGTTLGGWPSHPSPKPPPRSPPAGPGKHLSPRT